MFVLNTYLLYHFGKNPTHFAFTTDYINIFYITITIGVIDHCTNTTHRGALCRWGFRPSTCRWNAWQRPRHRWRERALTRPLGAPLSIFQHPAWPRPAHRWVPFLQKSFYQSVSLITTDEILRGGPEIIVKRSWYKKSPDKILHVPMHILCIGYVKQKLMYVITAVTSVRMFTNTNFSEISCL